MNTSSKSYKIGFSDYHDQNAPDTDGIDCPKEYLAGYKDAQEQDALAFDGANDHA